MKTRSIWTIGLLAVIVPAIWLINGCCTVKEERMKELQARADAAQNSKQTTPTLQQQSAKPTRPDESASLAETGDQTRDQGMLIVTGNADDLSTLADSDRQSDQTLCSHYRDPSTPQVAPKRTSSGGLGGSLRGDPSIPGCPRRGSAARPTLLRPDPRSMPSPEEEIWVISRYKSPRPTEEDRPGCGTMMAKLADQKEIPLPLKHTDVAASISAYIATVDVTQQYRNPYDTKIEAVYLFPLPQNSAVNEFIMTIGDRRIRGIIREREEAEQIYKEAKSQGYVASLLTQERPNVFTQSVANIEPGKDIDINIRYFHTLAYADGAYEYVFPMVIGPRFNPPGTTDGIGAVAQGKHGASGQNTEVQYLRPNTRSGHDISLSVDIDAATTIGSIQSRNHAITTDRKSDNTARVTLNKFDSIPNKDFVLRFEVAGQDVQSGLIASHDKTGGYFTLMLYPPKGLDQIKRAPVELVFVLDCSGSMNGKPIAQSKTAMERALKLMQPDDTFQIIRFSSSASQLGTKPLHATPENVEHALDYVESLNGSGGTMMIEGIKAALDFPQDDERLRFVVFLTDGQIGNEYDILAAIHEKLGDARIFSFGVGSSPNRYLLNRMAKMGRGAVAYLSLNDSAAQVMDCFFERISHPAMTDVQIDWGDANVKEVYPAQIPDLFVGRPVVLTGRYEGDAPTDIEINGRTGSTTRTIQVTTDNNQNRNDSSLPAIWARMKIADLFDRCTYQPPEFDLPAEIEQLALEYGLMSAYTAFVAVDSLTKTDGDHGITVAVPVPVPDGVRYETTVQE